MNVAARLHFIFLLTLVALCGCEPSELSEKQLTLYISEEEHGTCKSSSAKGIEIKVTFRPVDLLVAQELKMSERSVEKISSVRDRYKTSYYFLLSLSSDGREALHAMAATPKYSEMVNTISFGMARFVSLTTKKNSIPVAEYMLSPTYGLGKSTDLLFAFNAEDLEGEQWVQFNLNEFGLGVGDQEFRFMMKDLRNIPKLDFKIE